MTSNKKTLYVGGLAEDVDTEHLRSIFAAFGDIADINLPIDYTSQKHKGFAFVEFVSPDDASDAIDNMDNGEILGKTIRVNIAKPMRFKDTSKPIWSNDEYLRSIEDPSKEPSNEDANEESEKKQQEDSDEDESD